MALSEERLAGRIEFFRSQGHWQMKIEAPAWLMTDLAREVRQRGLHMLNYGGTDGPTLTMLIGTSAGGYDPEAPARNDSPAGLGEDMP